MHEEQRSMNKDNINFNELLERAIEFIKSRTSEHWVMFFIGLVLGWIIG